jgi:hypothetical protein
MYYPPNYHMAAGYLYGQQQQRASSYPTYNSGANNSRYSSPYPTSEYYSYNNGYQSPYPNAPDPYYSYYFNNYYRNQPQQAYQSMAPQTPSPLPQHMYGYVTPTHDLIYNNHNMNYGEQKAPEPYQTTSNNENHQEKSHTKSKKDRKKKKAPTFWLTKEFPDINWPNNNDENEANYKNYIYNSNYGYPNYETTDTYKNTMAERYGFNQQQQQVNKPNDSKRDSDSKVCLVLMNLLIISRYC